MNENKQAVGKDIDQDILECMEDIRRARRQILGEDPENEQSQQQSAEHAGDEQAGDPAEGAAAKRHILEYTPQRPHANKVSPHDGPEDIAENTPHEKEKIKIPSYEEISSHKTDIGQNPDNNIDQGQTAGSGIHENTETDEAKERPLKAERQISASGAVDLQPEKNDNRYSGAMIEESNEKEELIEDQTGAAEAEYGDDESEIPSFDLGQQILAAQRRANSAKRTAPKSVGFDKQNIGEKETEIPKAINRVVDSILAQPKEQQQPLQESKPENEISAAQQESAEPEAKEDVKQGRKVWDENQKQAVPAGFRRSINIDLKLNGLGRQVISEIVHRDIAVLTGPTDQDESTAKSKYWVN